MKFLKEKLKLFAKFKSVQQGERTGKWSQCCVGGRNKGAIIYNF
jgi:hypothetical protein